MLLTLWLVLNVAPVAQAQTFQAERDPPTPLAGKQYRLILHTPERRCADWRKVTPGLGRDDLLVSFTKRDEGKTGCRFLWVITSSVVPGPMKFELEPFGAGPKETFELAASDGYKPPAEPAAPTGIHLSGVADENGTGLSDAPVKKRLGLPAAVGAPDPASGK